MLYYKNKKTFIKHPGIHLIIAEVAQPGTALDC